MLRELSTGKDQVFIGTGSWVEKFGKFASFSVGHAENGSCSNWTNAGKSMASTPLRADSKIFVVSLRVVRIASIHHGQPRHTCLDRPYSNRYHASGLPGEGDRDVCEIELGIKRQ
jgi:hypothetical protein